MMREPSRISFDSAYNDVHLALPPNLLKPARMNRSDGEEPLPASECERLPFRELKGSASENVIPIFQFEKWSSLRMTIA